MKTATSCGPIGKKESKWNMMKEISDSSYSPTDGFSQQILTLRCPRIPCGSSRAQLPDHESWSWQQLRLVFQHTPNTSHFMTTTYVYIYIYICVYIYNITYTYLQIDRQMDRWIDGWMDG